MLQYLLTLLLTNCIQTEILKLGKNTHYLDSKIFPKIILLSLSTDS